MVEPVIWQSHDLIFLLSGFFNANILVASRFFTSRHAGQPSNSITKVAQNYKSKSNIIATDSGPEPAATESEGPIEVEPLFDPLFDFNGCINVLLWGAAYISVGINLSYEKSPYICLVFAIEKFFYFYKWMKMISPWSEFKRQLYWGPMKSIMNSKDVVAKCFYSTYGMGDLLFGLYFLSQFLRLINQ